MSYNFTCRVGIMLGLIGSFRVWGTRAMFWSNCRMVSGKTWEKEERGITFLVFGLFGSKKRLDRVFL